MLGKDNNNKKLMFNIERLDNQIKCKRKAEEVIRSCENNEQLNGAARFINLYFLLTNDSIGQGELEIELLHKRKNLQTIK